jgi:hypothetical protein
VGTNLNKEIAMSTMNKSLLLITLFTGAISGQADDRILVGGGTFDIPTAKYSSKRLHGIKCQTSISKKLKGTLKQWCSQACESSELTGVYRGKRYTSAAPFVQNMRNVFSADYENSSREAVMATEISANIDCKSGKANLEVYSVLTTENGRNYKSYLLESTYSNKDVKLAFSKGKLNVAFNSTVPIVIPSMKSMEELESNGIKVKKEKDRAYFGMKKFELKIDLSDERGEMSYTSGPIGEARRVDVSSGDLALIGYDEDQNSIENENLSLKGKRIRAFIKLFKTQKSSKSVKLFSVNEAYDEKPVKTSLKFSDL